MVDVGDPARNLVLNAVFLLVGLMTVVTLVPWGRIGATRLSRLLRWIPFPAAVLAVVYETAMPSRFDIRIDLLLLLPLYGLIIATSAFRWIAFRQADQR